MALRRLTVMHVWAEVTALEQAVKTFNLHNRAFHETLSLAGVTLGTATLSGVRGGGAGAVNQMSRRPGVTTVRHSRG